jgi:hypothetical protein
VGIVFLTIMVFSTSRTAENVHFLYNEKEIETVPLNKNTIDTIVFEFI